MSTWTESINGDTTADQELSCLTFATNLGSSAGEVRRLRAKITELERAKNIDFLKSKLAISQVKGQILKEEMTELKWHQQAMVGRLNDLQKKQVANFWDQKKKEQNIHALTEAHKNQG
uniref:Kinesin motor domain-containing protein n=1 Tax=Globodera pallida TaxID=36090 RepID=A0A183BN61_GLOPA